MTATVLASFSGHSFESLLEILNPDFVLRNSLYASVLIGAVVPLVGVFLVIGRRTILALALPQVSTLGVALIVWSGTFLGVNWTFNHHGALFLACAISGAVAAMAAALIWEFLVERRCATPGEAETGALYALAAAGTLAIAASNLVPELGLLDVLRGEILAVPDSLLLSVAVGFSLILLVLVLFRRALHFVLYDAVLAHASGFAAKRVAFLTLGLISVTVALGGLCAGPLTIFAFLVLPPLTFLPLVRHLRHLYVASVIMGLVCAFCGFWISFAIEEWTLPIPSAQVLLLCAVWIGVRLWLLIRNPARGVPNASP